MKEILVAVPIISAVVFGTTSLIKKEAPMNKHLPVINCVTGISLGLIYALTINHGDFSVYGWAGFISGLSAGGFYDLTQTGKEWE